MENPTRESVLQIAQTFIDHEISDLLGLTLGTDRTELALNLVDHETTDQNGHRREQFEIERLLTRCFEFAIDRRQGSDDQADQKELQALVNFDAGQVVVQSTLKERQKVLGSLLDHHEAVMAFELGEDEDMLTREQIALISGLAVETVRLAAFAEGDDRLPQERPGESTANSNGFHPTFCAQNFLRHRRGNWLK